ncbi:MAG: peptide chain release factor N(5)-glutamine methyltransferase [Rhodospirillales bacterium]|nr:peptide chain release factor N(5)-glutamine methyltransferase [Rhodospirillales bacterium]
MTFAQAEAAAARHTTVGELLRRATRTLQAGGIDLPALEARLLVGYALALSREALLAEPGRPVGVGEAQAVESLVARRREHEPLAYILGEREFWSLPFRVGPEVLIPRPDSETLVETALGRLGGSADQPVRILDLGTGSGCLLLALLSERASAVGVGVDRSEPAVALARANAARLGVGARSAFVCADWGAAFADGRFDLIVANPPYVDAEGLARLEPTVRRFEPEGALSGGVDGLDAYRALAPQLSRLLSPAGFAVVEIGAGQRHPVAGVLAGAGLEVAAVGRDLAGHERCLVLRRC